MGLAESGCSEFNAENKKGMSLIKMPFKDSKFFTCNSLHGKLICPHDAMPSKSMKLVIKWKEMAC